MPKTPPTPAKPTSGLRLHYRVETSDGEIIDVTTGVIDMLRWEKSHAGQSWLAESSMTAQLWVVWAAAKRAKLVETTDVDGWIASVVDFEIISEADAADSNPGEIGLDPTPPAP